MSGWGPGVTHWQVGEDVFYAINVDDATDGKLPKFITPLFKEIEKFTDIDVKTCQILPTPTTLVRCDENGVAIDSDLTTPAIEIKAEFTFPPGTSAKDALVFLGYEVG